MTKSLAIALFMRVQRYTPRLEIADHRTTDADNRLGISVESGRLREVGDHRRL